METLVVLSKIKKYIKETHSCNTSANFFEPLNQDVIKSLDEAIAHAQNSGRKTVMGKDFNFYIHNPMIEENLVVASKVKKYIKEKSGLATSSQAFEQLSARIIKICDESANKSMGEKRKTVMDRDFTAPTMSAATV